jgi:acetyl-CoA acyltransferase
MAKKGKRIAIISGCRTPFTKAGTQFRHLSAVDLGRIAVTELLSRAEVRSSEVEQLTFGSVLPSPKVINVAREISLRAGIPASAPACTVNLACASANEALIRAAESILLGHCAVAVAGGTESLSDAPLIHSREFREALQKAACAKRATDKLRAFAALKIRDLRPDFPALIEPTIGLSMGESAEKMAKENGITRKDQDALALRSHQRAWTAAEEGRFTSQLAPVCVPPEFAEWIERDTGIRSNANESALASLPPIFDPLYGSVTAGNSSPLSDGASALLVMSEEKAQSLGCVPLGYLRSYAVAALSPSDQLLMGSVYAVPKALHRARVAFQDIGLFEMHEAFAAQLLSNIGAMASVRFARDVLGLKDAIGEVDMERLNVCGGSIAIGHPFGATGARLVMTLLEEMRRRQLALGMVTVCAAGGIGVAMIFESGEP